MPIILTEYLSISGVVLANPAYFITDLSDVRRPADQRGRDRIIPHGGVLAKPRRRTVSKRMVPMIIDGSVDTNGAPTGNYQAGMEGHLAYLNANVVAPVSSGDGTRPATLMLAWGPKYANVHVEALEIGRRSGPTAWATLHLSIPGGEFF